MKRIYKWAVVIGMIVLMMTCMMLSASASHHYEPDGTAEEIYCYDASECNRKLVVNCVDESGTLIKKVVYHTKRGEEGVEGFFLYGYDLISYESDQGLWETCKMTNQSGTGLCWGAYIQTRYKFTSGLSKDVLTVTATVRRYDDVTVVTRHFIQERDKHYTWSVRYVLESSTSQVVTYYDYISTSKKTITGYTLKDGYESSISGNLTYKWEGDYLNTPSNPRFYEYELHQTNYKYEYEDVKSYNEDKHGKLDYCTDRVFYIDYYYDLKEYTIKFNANGGTGAPEAMLKYYGHDITIPETVPTREGYTFLGWGTYSTDTTPNYQPGETYTSNSTRNLYAVWQEDTPTPSTYSVQYNANGGIGEPATQTKTHDVTLQLSSDQPTREGCTFLGWAKMASATTALYYAGSNYTDNASVTLYAVWSYIEPSPVIFEVSYHANGGTGAPSTQYKAEGESLTLSTTKPTRSGYTFLGWNPVSSALGPVYYAGDTYLSNSSILLYAVWQENIIIPQIYTVAYYGNGGTGAPGSQTKTENVTLILSDQVPVRSNYRFLGWSTDASATMPTYMPGSSYTTNANLLLYAVWEYAPVTYSIWYDANGGTGAPSSQTKTYGLDLLLSQVKPTRDRYNFLGWSTSSVATTATYAPGAVYSTNASATLYAVWEKANYEFSISNLTVSDNAPFRYGQITVSVRTDSWDRVNAYTDIPVQLLYDGAVVATEYVDFAAYGVAYATFTLNVGAQAGQKSVEARINWDARYSETDFSNNSVSIGIEVQDYDYEMAVDNVTMTGNYCEGMTVISSFTINNDSDYDIIPDMNNTAIFRAYYYKSGQKIVVATDEWNKVVIPSGGTNLVYFKWTVPEGMAGKTVYCECTVNEDDMLNEQNKANNTATFSKVIVSMDHSQTPNTRFEGEAPSSYQSVSPPSVSMDQATWTMWEYVNGSFVLRRYGVQISSESPVVAPSSDCVTAVYERGLWVMRSGYGITIRYTPTISVVSGYNLPDDSAYTSIQYVMATFPEFRYFDTEGNYRTLEDINGNYSFPGNSYAYGNARVHFIPVYVEDGNYVVCVTATQVWTPVGMIEVVRHANVIRIDGTIYDDWYQS